MKNITLDELSQYKKDNALLIDVRLPGDFAKEHLEGAINMPYTNILSLLKSYPKDTPLILYCDLGHYSKRVGNMLLALGYTHVYNLKIN